MTIEICTDIEKQLKGALFLQELIKLCRKFNIAVQPQTDDHVHFIHIDSWDDIYASCGFDCEEEFQDIEEASIDIINETIRQYGNKAVGDKLQELIKQLRG